MYRDIDDIGYRPYRGSTGDGYLPVHNIHHEQKKRPNLTMKKFNAIGAHRKNKCIHACLASRVRLNIHVAINRIYNYSHTPMHA